MKKTVIALCAVVLVSLAATSCKKTCTCTGTVLGASVSHEVGKMKTSECESYNPSAEVPGIASFKCTTE